MNENEIVLMKELQKENVWWSKNNVPEQLSKTKFHRADYYAYQRLLENQKFPLVVFGPRQIGKSTVMYQLIDNLIDVLKVSPNRLLFLSLDRAFFKFVKNPIKVSIKLFEENVLKEPLENLKEPIYVFLDEASREPLWATQIKEYVDRKYKIKFVITGSSSPALFQESSESLVGRQNPTLMLTLKFRDVLKLLGDPETTRLLKIKTKTELRSSLVKSLEMVNPSFFYEELQDLNIKYGTEGEKRMLLSLNKYFLRGGYPKFYDNDSNWDETSKIMRDAYFDAIMGHDIVRVFGVRNPDKIKELYAYISRFTSDRMNFTSMGGTLALDRKSLDRYVGHLLDTYLISYAKAYKKNPSKSSKDITKFYVGDVGMRNAVLGLLENEISDVEHLGRVAETVAHNHTRRLKFNIDRAGRNEMFFWKTKEKKEVDILVKFGPHLIPIEVKYRNNIPQREKSNIVAAMETFKSPFGIILTKNKLNLNGKLLEVPLWMYLLLC